MVDLKSFVDVDPKNLKVTESVYYPVLEKILEENDDLIPSKKPSMTASMSDSEAYHERGYHRFHQL